MINTINSDLIRGNINTIILKSLYEGDRYGYDIIKEIEQKSSGQYKLKQPTLYSCLKRLEVQGFIRSYWGAKSNGGRRKYFTLTDMGRDVFQQNKNDWEYSRTVIDKLISDKEYNISTVEIIDDTENDTENTKDVLDENKNSFDEKLDTVDEYDSKIFASDNSENASIIDETAFTKNIDNQAPDYLDSSQIINELFDLEQNENSYTDKLINDKYIGNVTGKAYSADTYFNDFFDGYKTKTNTLENDVDVPEQTLPALSQNFEQILDTVDIESSVQHFEMQETEKKISDSFLSYNKPIEKNDNNTDKHIIERDYRNILGKLITEEITDSELMQKTRKVVNDPITDEMKINIAKIEAKTNAHYDDIPNTFSPTSKEHVLNMNLNKMAEVTRQSTGDTVKNRIYDSRIDMIYRTQYHYYSNKLKLHQFAILFGFMLLSIIATFLVSRFVLNIYQSHDLYFYVIGVLVAASLPIAAAIMNFLDPNKIKTGEFRLQELKENLFYKIWIMLCCIVIIYCTNLFLDMPVSFSKEYFATLLLPFLFALCLPLSSIIFYFLYNSKRFNQT